MEAEETEKTEEITKHAMKKAAAISQALGDEIAPSTIYKMAAEGRIRSYQAGRKDVRFILAEVLEDLRRPMVNGHSIIAKEEKSNGR